MKKPEEQYVQIEISASKLASLIANGELIAAECHGLTSEAKEALWHIFLRSALIDPNFPQNQV